MKISKLPLCAAVSAMFAAVPTTSFAAIDSLNLSPGVYTCLYGGTYPSCVYSAYTVGSGSWFAMDANGNGSVESTEKIAMQITNTLVFDNLTPATGSHAGSIDGSENPVLDIWGFFGSVGMDYLTAPIVDNGNGTLDMSGWTATWNGISAIPLGGDPANFASDTGLGSVSCGACNNGDAFTLEYTSHVALGDPSGFGGVGYTLHLEGTISITGLGIGITGGAVQECNAPNGNQVTAVANAGMVFTPETVIDWTLDGQAAGQGGTFNQFVGLGDHVLTATAYDTLLGENVAVATSSLTIKDTTPPTVNAQFLEKISGTPISNLQLKANFIEIQADGVTDVCDPAAAITSVFYGIPSNLGSFFTAFGYSGDLVVPQPQVVLRVKAKDASGNTIVENAVLNAP